VSNGAILLAAKRNTLPGPQKQLRWNSVRRTLFSRLWSTSQQRMVQRSLEETHIPTGSEDNGGSDIEDDSSEGGWTALAKKRQ